MPRRVFIIMAMLAMTVPLAAPRPSEAFEIFHRRYHCQHSPGDHTVPRRPQAPRWYADYRPMAGDDFGGGVASYAYGYFGAKSHSAYGCHRGYYGDMYTWGPLRGH